jgi:hypothetical protein
MPVQLRSSTLATAEYDAASTQLTLAFHDGSRYRYSGVPGHLFLNLLGAPSQGRFFNQQIRAKFTCERLL